MQGDEETLDPIIAAVLQALWQASLDDAGRPATLAKLSKWTRLPMSTLRRTLTQLQAAGLLSFSVREDGTGSAALTATGMELCTAIFPAQP